MIRVVINCDMKKEKLRNEEGSNIYTGTTNILNRYCEKISLLYTGIHFKGKFIPVWTNEFLEYVQN